MKDEMFNSYKNCIELIKSDYFRYVGKRASFWKIWIYGLSHPAIHYTIWLRLSSYREGWAFLYAKYRHRKLMRKYGMLIPSITKIGYGFYLGHCLGVVINSNCIIGNNVNVGHFVTLGGVKGHAPVVGDNVYIGPNVCIVGGVHIGNNVTIGAGSVVTKDIPDNCTVAGVPAKVISDRCHEEYINNRYEIEKC